MKRLFAGILLAGMLASPRGTSAELLWFKDSPQDNAETARTITDIERQQRFFGRLDSKDDVDYFTFSADAKQKIDLLLETPVADGDFKPVMVLFGPGLPAPTEDPTIQIGDTNGAIVTHAKDERAKRFDQFLMTSFNTGPTISVEAPQKGTYAIAVRSPKGSTGRYVLHIGSENGFRWDELWQGIVGTLKGLLRLY